MLLKVQLNSNQSLEFLYHLPKKIISINVQAVIKKINTYLYYTIVRLQQSDDISRTPLSDPIDVHTFFIQPVTDTKPIIIVNRILVQRHVVNLIIQHVFMTETPHRSFSERIGGVEGIGSVEMRRRLSVVLIFDGVGEVVVWQWQRAWTEYFFSVWIELQLGISLVLFSSWLVSVQIWQRFA